MSVTPDERRTRELERVHPSHRIDTTASMPGDHRAAFFVERFKHMLPSEQAVILGAMEGRHPESYVSKRIHKAIEFMQEWSSARRLRRFIRKMQEDAQPAPDDSNPKPFAFSTAALIKQQQRYLPALTDALISIWKGDDIGVMTARGSFEGNNVLVQAIEGYLGHEIQKQFRYFVNDANRNQRLASSSTAKRKLEVLFNYCHGYYFTASDELRVLPRRYNEVVFIDDEDKNIQAVEGAARLVGLEDRLKVVDARKLNHEALWEELVAAVAEGPPEIRGSSGRIKFYDIDGTLVNVPALMYVRDKETDEIYQTITQLDLAEHRDINYWIGLAAEAHPEVPRERLFYDFGDFHDASRVQHQVRPGMFHLNGAQ